ncbi:MAG: hypothetical protein ACFFD2_05575 [Promethearchaeota archaeon]
MTIEKPRVTIRFIHPDRTTEYLVTQSEAMELEILAITRPPKRLMKTIRRVGIDLLERAVEDELNQDLILGSSRSGDVYNALKYLEYKNIIERRKDIKLIKIHSKDDLNQVINKIETLLKI